MAAPYVLARTLREAHAFARGQLGLRVGHYRIVNSASTIKSVRGADLYLVPGWENRYDRFAVKGAIRWTRMNVIDVAQQQAEEPPAVPDDLEPAGEQLIIATPDEVAEFFDTSNGDNMVAEGGPANDPTTYNDDGVDIAEQAEEPAAKPKNRRRSRCKNCGNLHYKEDPCPDESVLAGT